MKKLKRKILIPTIAAISTLAIVAPLSLSLTTKAIVSNNNTSVVNNSLKSIPYTTVSYNTDKDDLLGEWTVSLVGPWKVRAEEGVPFGSIQRPKAVHSLNWKFLGWSKVKGSSADADLVKDDDPIPPKSEGTLNLYPVFETPALLSNCLCISAIEDTDITIHFQDNNPTNKAPVDMWYSTDFGTTWKEIEHEEPDDVKLPTLIQGGTIYFKGNNPDGLSYGDGWDEHTSFMFDTPEGSTTDAKVNIFGNAMGLVNNGSRENQKNKQVPCDYCFYGLFAGTNDYPNTAIEYVADNFFPCEQYKEDGVAKDAQTLKKYCYANAFAYCTEMLHAPRLFATTAAVKGEDDNTAGCYSNIYRGCEKVDFIRTRYNGLATEASSQFDNWVTGVAPSGTFIYDGTDSAKNFGFPENTWSPKKCPDNGTAGIEIHAPESGTNLVADHEYEFTATALKDGSSAGVYDKVYWASSNEAVAGIDHSTGKITGHPVSAPTEVTITCFSAANLNAYNTIKITVLPIELANCTWITNPSTTEDTKISYTYVGNPPEGVFPTFRYTLDNGKTWLEWTRDTEITIPKQTGAEPNTLYVKGYNPKGLSNGEADSYTQFKTSSGSFKLGGTVKGLLNDGLPGSSSDVIPCDYCFSYLFSGSNVTEVPAGYLPYKEGQLTKGCYAYMFAYCDKLTTAKDNGSVKFLPATALTDKDGNDADCCYEHMFYKSGALNTMFTLPATSLSAACYYGMFYGCSSIKETPELTAETAKEKCYRMMFQECSSVTKIRPVGLKTLEDESCFQMFSSIDWAYNHYISGSGNKVLIFTVPDQTGKTDTTTRFLYRSTDRAQISPSTGTKIYIYETL